MIVVQGLRSKLRVEGYSNEESSWISRWSFEKLGCTLRGHEERGRRNGGGKGAVIAVSTWHQNCIKILEVSYACTWWKNGCERDSVRNGSVVVFGRNLLLHQIL